MVVKSSSCTGLEFIPVSLRVSPPCEGGVRGGGPGGTSAWYAVPGRLGQAGAPAEGQGPSLRSKVLVMPCSPPLTPPSQGGEMKVTRPSQASQGREMKAQALWGLLLGAGCFLLGSTAYGQAPAHVDRLSFRQQVAPILVKKCLGCHNELKASGGLSMTTFAALKRGGKMAGETILRPGDPDGSSLIESVREGAAPRMPYKLPPLTQVEIGTLSRWVKEGAEFDGPSASQTALGSLVDRLAGLPKVALKVPAGCPDRFGGLLAGWPRSGGRVGTSGRRV